jgi:hypothetical protein
MVKKNCFGSGSAFDRVQNPVPEISPNDEKKIKSEKFKYSTGTKKN